VTYLEHPAAPEMGDGVTHERLSTEQKAKLPPVKAKSEDDPVTEVIKGTKPPAVKKADAKKAVKTP
jgi:hypothetical protein